MLFSVGKDSERRAKKKQTCLIFLLPSAGSSFLCPGRVKKKPCIVQGFSLLWALTDSNRRPSACKADALNQLS